jgi:hypothetical protein
VSARRRLTVAALAGGLLLALHAAVFPALMGAFDDQGLSVRVSSPSVADKLDIDAVWPAALDRRIAVETRAGGPSIDGPVMHRVEWSVRYRGGFERRVGRTQLVGPFQKLARPPCSLRVLLGQRLLDGLAPRQDPVTGPVAGPLGAAVQRALDSPEPGSVARVVASMIESQLAGFERWPIGAFRGVSGMRMRWVGTADIDRDDRRQAVLAAARSALREHGGAAVTGVLQATFRLRFDDGDVPIWLAVIPVLGRHGLTLAAHVDAELDFDSWFYQQLSDWFGGDDYVTRTARGELDQAFASVFSLPPPIELARGHRLRFRYCEDKPVDIITGGYAAVPMRLVYEHSAGVAPVYFGAADAERPRARVRDMTAPVAVEFELDALNGIVHALWRSGMLDQELDRAGLDQQFNDNQQVRALSSVRLGQFDLALPPTIWRSSPGPGAPHFQLGVDADLSIHDRDATTPAHIFGAVGLDFRAGADAPLVADLTLDQLALTCEPEPGLLTPCYADLVAAVRDRADAVHGQLTERFTALFGAVVLHRRIDLERAAFDIENARVQTVEDAGTDLIRVELFGRLRMQE